VRSSPAPTVSWGAVVASVAVIETRIPLAWRLHG
jgi:hypothetical protein